MRVFLTHNPEDLEAYYGRALPELEAIAEVACNPLDRDLEPDELARAATGCAVVIAHRSTPAGRALFAARPELLAFLRCAVDISTIDLEAANAHGVLIARAGPSYVASTAELALGLALDLARHITDSAEDYRAGRPPPPRPGRQLAGRTAGLIGYGAIGSRLADLLVAVGMRVVVHDPAVDEVASGVEQLPLDDVLAQAEVLFPLVPGTPANEDLIGPAELARMRPGALLVNVSRGEVLDEDAVAAALDSGRLGGLGLDVGRAADQRPSSALASRRDVVATPHLGGLTPENADAQARSSVEQVAAILAGEMPPRSVNADAAARLRSYWKEHR